MAKIDETLTSTNTTTREIPGSSFMHPVRVDGAMVTIQVVPPTGGAAFEVHIEAAAVVVNDDGSAGELVWSQFGRWTQESELFLQAFPVSASVFYRVRHISGGDVRVLMSG